MTFQNIALIVTVIFAFLGYLITYRNNLVLAQRKERLDLINRQINGFYGPLYILSKVGEIAYTALVTKLQKNDTDPDLRESLNEEEFSEWRIWVITVFMPINIAYEQIILRNAYPIREEEIPDCILRLITHVSAYKAVVNKWQQNDYSDRFSLIDFPEELYEYAR